MAKVQKPFAKLSERQRNILKFIDRYIQKFGYPPTIREIGEATHIQSTSVVNYNLNKLVMTGYLERSDHVSRGLRLVTEIPGMKTKIVKLPAGEAAIIPIVGHIVAGEPIEVPDDIAHYVDEDSYIDVPPSLLRGIDPDETFALRVQGDSMIDAMIRDGDIVVIRRQYNANNGDMIAAWLPEESKTTLKYYYHEGTRIRLQPAHPTMEPIFVPVTKCEVRGRVLTVIRQL